MKRTLVLATLCLFSIQAGASGSKSRLILSSQSNGVGITVTTVEGRTVFRKCATDFVTTSEVPQVIVRDCQTLGREQGYTDFQIRQRLHQLKQEASSQKTKKALWLVSTTAGLAGFGALQGMLLGYFAKSTRQANYIFAGTTAGGAVLGAGFGIGTIGQIMEQSTGSKVSAQEGINALKMVDAEVQIIDDSLENLAAQMSYALMGIE